MKNGCPSAPGGGGELARKARELEREKALLEERLRDRGQTLRDEAARAEREKLARERAELAEYRKFYDDGLERIRRQLEQKRREVEALQKENEALRSRAPPAHAAGTVAAAAGTVAAAAGTVAAGGAGAGAAGRDAAVDNHVENNIVFNLYGSEEWDPDKHAGMVKQLRGVVDALVESGRGRELMPRMLEASIAKMGDAPGNRTLRGYSRCLDQVGAQVDEGRWEGREPGKIAAEYAEKISDAFEARGEKMKRMPEATLESWANGPGGDEVVRLAMRNADRAGDSTLIFTERENEK